MFNQYSRTQFINKKGIYFYEQDIIYDDYVYQGDMIIDIKLDYYHNGFGLVLFPYPGLKIENQKTNYLFKISSKELSIYVRNNETLKKIKSSSVLIAPPITNLDLTFSKIGRQITILHQNQMLLSYQLPTAFYKQSVGYYSNKGNIIKSISIASKIPKDWSINMSNTLGGRLSFKKDAFKLESCINNAEIIQENISLKAGTYYLEYNKSEDCDIVAYIILEGDEQLLDRDKNLLTENIFTLAADSNVILKFTGKKGLISQVQISKVADTKYVSTTDEKYIFEGSEITVATKEIVSVEIEFKIINEIYKEFQNHILSNLIESYNKEDLLLDYHESYILKYDCISRMFKIYKDNQLISDGFFKNISYTISFFKNIEADIKHFILTYKNGTIKDITNTMSNIELVDNTLLSPIIVINSNEEPMDLSSSFREITNNEQTAYVFTNIERETFNINEPIFLSKDVSDKPGAVKIYGIPTYENYDKNFLYKGTPKNIHDLSSYCKNYITIDSEKFFIEENSVNIDYVELQKYKKIIIDYEKANSYCINFNYILQTYEVEITEDKYKILYDKTNYNTKSSTSNQTEDKFKYTSIKPFNKQYIVLRKEGE